MSRNKHPTAERFLYEFRQSILNCMELPFFNAGEHECHTLAIPKMPNGKIQSAYGDRSQVKNARSIPKFSVVAKRIGHPLYRLTNAKAIDDATASAESAKVRPSPPQSKQTDQEFIDHESFVLRKP